MDIWIPFILDLVDDVAFALMTLLPCKQYYMVLFNNWLSKLYR